MVMFLQDNDCRLQYLGTDNPQKSLTCTISLSAQQLQALLQLGELMLQKAQLNMCAHVQTPAPLPEKLEALEVEKGVKRAAKVQHMLKRLEFLGQQPLKARNICRPLGQESPQALLSLKHLLSRFVVLHAGAADKVRVFLARILQSERQVLAGAWLHLKGGSWVGLGLIWARERADVQSAVGWV